MQSPDRYILKSYHDLRQLALRWFIIGATLGALLGIVTTLGVQPQEVIDTAMEKACKWPIREGQMTVVTVLNDRVVCWEWKQ